MNVELPVAICSMAELCVTHAGHTQCDWCATGVVPCSSALMSGLGANIAGPLSGGPLSGGGCIVGGGSPVGMNALVCAAFAGAADPELALDWLGFVLKPGGSLG